MLAYRLVTSETIERLHRLALSGDTASRLVVPLHQQRLAHLHPDLHRQGRPAHLRRRRPGLLEMSIWPDRGQRVLQHHHHRAPACGRRPGADQVPPTTAPGANASPIDARPSLFTTGSCPTASSWKCACSSSTASCRRRRHRGSRRTTTAVAARGAALAPIRKPGRPDLACSLALFIPIAGGIGLYMYWYNKGRDKPVGLVADYMPNPPVRLAGRRGGHADRRERRPEGHRRHRSSTWRAAASSRIKEAEKPRASSASPTVTSSIRSDKPDAAIARLRAAAHQVSLFGRRSEVSLSDLKEKFYVAPAGDQGEDVRRGGQGRLLRREPQHHALPAGLAFGCWCCVLAGVAFFVLMGASGSGTAAECACPPSAWASLAVHHAHGCRRAMPAAPTRAPSRSGQVEGLLALPAEHREVHQPQRGQGHLRQVPALCHRLWPGA